MKDVTQQLADALREAEDALAGSYEVVDYPANGRSRQDAALAKVREALTAYEASRAALSAMSRDDALEALRELLDEHDKAHGETKYTPAKQPPYSMTMDSLHRQTFAAMYAYVRNKLAQKPRS